MANSLTTEVYNSITLTSAGAYASPFTITNTGSVAPQAGSVAGVYAAVANVTLINQGAIDTAGNATDGVTFQNGGFLSNAVSGTITGSHYGIYLSGNATATNAGTIIGTHYNGVQFFGSGTISNLGTAALISGGSRGLNLDAGTISVINSGTIQSPGAAAIELDSFGTITNSGLIKGGSNGINISSGTVTNAGTISGATNAINFGAANNSMLIVDVGAVFDGIVVGQGTGNVLALGSTAPGMVADISGISNTTLNTAAFNDFATIAFDTGAHWSAAGAYNNLEGEVVTGFTVGDTLVLDGFAATTDTYVSGTGLELGNGTNRVTLDITGNFTTANFSVTEPAASTTTIMVHCYSRGTRIETPLGDIEIESLAVGDMVFTASGAVRPIRWIGTRSFDPRFVGRNPKILPIRICKDALADGVPRRDLLVSPEHAMLIDGVLVAAKYLVNGVSIRQEDPGAMIEYFHIELDTHDAVLAEGAASETYIEDGDRGMFRNAATHRAHNPDSMQPARYCAERIEAGARLESIRARLEARAGVQAIATDEPDIHLLADGAVLLPRSGADGTLGFDLPRATGDLVLVSRLTTGTDADRRTLGIAVAGIMIDGQKVDLGALPDRGWHEIEQDGSRRWRWTDGSGQLPATSAPCRLTVAVASTLRYRRFAMAA